METDPERPQTLTLPHFPSFFFLAGVKKETHYAERTLNIPGILNPYRFCFQRDGPIVSEMTQCVGRLKSEQDA